MHTRNIYLIVLLFIVYLYTMAQEDTLKAKQEKIQQEYEAALMKAKEMQKDSTKTNIRWATSVISFSSEYDKIDKSAQQVLGKPNVLPTGGDALTAWAVKMKKGNESSDPAFIRVGYDNPIRVHQVAVGESWNPGAITKIILYGTNNESEIVYDKPAGPVGKSARMFNIFLPKATDFYVKEVEVHLDPVKVPGWNMIDAIGIADGMDTIKAKINQLPNLRFEEKAENLGGAINTIYDELSPMISPDSKTLYFVRKFHPDNIGGYQDEDDIWFSNQGVDGKWEQAKNIGKPLNTKHNNFVQSITPDGNALLLANVYLSDGSMADGVSLTYRTGDGWSMPEKQIIDEFINYSPYANYFLSNDGRFLLMALQRKDTYGQLDLYVCFLKEPNRWSKPINLGPVINTITNDYSPFLAADGITMFYSTSGYSGYGKADIFMTTRLDDSWTNWSDPINLGPVLNSAENDSKYNIPASGEYAFYSSTNNSLGKSDIFKIRLPKAVKPKPVVLITGKVLSDKTGKGINAIIKVEELPSGKEAGIARTDPNTGEYKIILPAGKKYGYRAVAPGFFDLSLNKDYTSITEYTEITEDDIRLKPIEVGVSVKLNNIFFEFGKATLLPESYPELDRVVEFLTTNDKIDIDIEGHTDNVGSDEFNLKLSQARAESVTQYITSKGIPTNRIKAIGYGETRPEYFNDTDENRAKNRRVVFTIKKINK